MCGIFVLINKKNNPIDLARCKRATARLKWRGPDQSSNFTHNDTVFFGQTILSITGNISNREGDHLVSKSKRYLITYNGEIYNFNKILSRYLTNVLNGSRKEISDTEILVNLHEVLRADKIPHLLDGMYSYVSYDSHTNKIYISRDIQGEKSLFYYEDDSQIIICSQIDAIVEFVPNLSIDKNTIRDYFHTRHLMSNHRTTYSDISQIKPGEFVQIDLNTMHKKSTYSSITDWIDSDKIIDNESKTLDDLEKEFDSIFSSCIKSMLPDTKYASVLSGGVDSSLVSAYCLKYGNPDAFVAINHIGKDEISNNLSVFEDVLNINIDVIDVRPELYASEIKRAQNIIGGPLFSHSFIGQSIQSAYVNNKGCKVLMGGEGADELFGGYNCYLDTKSDNYEYSPSLYTKYLNNEIEFKDYDSLPLKNELSDFWKTSLESYSSIKDKNDQKSLSMMLCDFMLQVPSVGLRGADLMSMMWGVETRSVFMRKDLIKFALNLPIHAKINPTANDLNIRTKVLLKKSFLNHFPKKLLVSKQGFAGFPNESIKYLGDVRDFIALDFLDFNKNSIDFNNINRDIMWKLINVEYFLRK